MPTILALIPARSGSKGIPDKNIRMFKGRPLLQRAVDVGLEITPDTYVSTDSRRYAELADVLGAKVIMRPTDLTQDDTPMLPVVKHALDVTGWKHELIVLLQPTSPLRTARMVSDAVGYMDQGGSSVVSVTEVPRHLCPDYVLAIEGWDLRPYQRDYGTLGRMPTRRQDTQRAYARDGSVYVLKASQIAKGDMYGPNPRPYIVHALQSATLDSELDWKRAEAMA